MAGVLDILGQSVLPKVNAKLAAKGVLEIMNIVRPTEVQGDGGGMIKSDEEVLYQNIPVDVIPRRRYLSNVSGDKPQSTSFFDLEFALIGDGEFMTVTADCKLVVAERGVIPERVFRIEDIQNEGVNYLAFCNEGE